MAQHFVRGIDDALFRRVKIRAVTEGLTLKQVIIRLFQMYAEGVRLPKTKA